MISETASKQYAQIFPAMKTCQQALPFELEEAELVRLTYRMAFLYTEEESIRLRYNHEQLEAYLTKYSAEEIAGHIRLWKLEWRC